MSVEHAKYDWDTMDFGGTSRYDFDRLRNAEPETLAEAVVDACSDVAHGLEPFDEKPDGQFMRAAVEKLQSKLRSLASMAQADPVKSFAFYNVLETAHSFRERHVPYEYKNGVRVKRKCMGCGREEKNCTTAVSLAGPYDYKAFSSGADKLSDAWKRYEENYSEVFAEDWVEGPTVLGQLPHEDRGDYMLGECCLRKAKLTFFAQTLMAELLYEARVVGGRNDYGEEEIQKLLVDVRNLELCIADGQRALPVNLDPMFTDDKFWAQIDEARSAAARGLQHKIPELAGNRARERMGQPPLSEEQQQEAGSEEDVYASDEDGVDEGDDAEGPRNDDEPVRRHRLRKARRAVLPEDEEESDAEIEVKGVGRHQRDCAPKARRQSKRLRGCEPSPERAPEADEEARPRLEKKKSRPGAASLARAQRIPGGALAARTEVLCELTKLKLRLMREGHREDAAVCTAAIFTLEELMELNRRAE